MTGASCISMMLLVEAAVVITVLIDDVAACVTREYLTPLAHQHVRRACGWAQTAHKVLSCLPSWSDIVRHEPCSHWRVNSETPELP
ncbi:hypothetical protein BD414DRAFT_86788 [Trametes punicea]|nr:hypothetical protein BD414DRAFT_86788 [Trametes punicea]